MSERIEFTVNGERRAVDAPPMARLLDVLREHLHLTGTKEGCGEGECGSCAVMMNGELVNSCLVPVLQAEGSEIRTIEGAAQDGRMSVIQQKFLECGAAAAGGEAWRAAADCGRHRGDGDAGRGQAGSEAMDEPGTVE